MIWDDEGINPDWPTKPLETLAKKVGSGATPRGGRRTYPNHGIPFIRSQNVHFDGFTTDGLAFLTNDQARQLNGATVQADDVLLNITGASIGRVCVAPAEMAGARVNQHVCIIRPTGVKASFLASYLASPQVQDAITFGNYGVTREALTKSQILELPVPVPPIADQEKLTRLLEVARMHRSKAITYIGIARKAVMDLRTSVIAAACSGRLTRDWREAHPDAPQITKAQLGSRSSKRTRKTQDAPVGLTLPDLPDSYTLATIGDVAERIEYGTSQALSPATEGSIPILRMGNIQDGNLDLTTLKYHVLDTETKKLLLRDGDLLFNRTNSPELVGKSAVYRGDEPMSFASYLIRVRLSQATCDPHFANYWINSTWGRAWARQVKTDGVSQSNINGTKLAMMPIPLPPIEEQREIVRRASQLLSTADTLLNHLNGASRTVERTSPAILAKAFRGDLVSSST